MEQKKVKVEIMSSNGHDTLILEPLSALERCRTETDTKGKWCYIDGKFCKSEDLTAEAIGEAEVVTLVNALQGG